MRLRRFQVSNFRGFEDRALDFHPNFNVLIGINGVGKTTRPALTGGAFGLPPPGARFEPQAQPRHTAQERQRER
jgi:predicted ATPase